MIRVLVAEDSHLAASMMLDLLKQDPEIKVVGWAKNGLEAIRLRNSLEPDVITMDLNMPVMNGLDAIERINSTHPLPILVVSQMIDGPNSDLAFEALRRGAVDIMGKPSGYMGFSQMKEEFISRIKAAAGVRPVRLLKKPAQPSIKAKAEKSEPSSQILVAIGASTGGPPALAFILKSLPPDLPSPIAVVQHIAPGFVTGLAQWLDRETPFSVEVARDREALKAGAVYLAPDGHHLEVGRDKKMVLSGGAPVRGHRPSIDRLMESAARSYGKNAVGVLLTGMGSDGAEGLKRMREAGARTIAQDEATSLVYGMPREAVLREAADVIRPLEEIAQEIAKAIPPKREP